MTASLKWSDKQGSICRVDMTELTTISGDDFRAAMRHLTASVHVVTTGLDKTTYSGLTATVVCSVSAEPPSIVACVNKDARAHDIIVSCKRFAINLLTEDQTELSGIFSDPSLTEKRFDKCKWHKGQSGLPLIDEALVTFECTLHTAHDAFSHSLFVGVIEAVHISKGRPLLYEDGNYGIFKGK